MPGAPVLPSVVGGRGGGGCVRGPQSRLRPAPGRRWDTPSEVGRAGGPAGAGQQAGSRWAGRGGDLSAVEAPRGWRCRSRLEPRPGRRPAGPAAAPGGAGGGRAAEAAGQPGESFQVLGLLCCAIQPWGQAASLAGGRDVTPARPADPSKGVFRAVGPRPAAWPVIWGRSGSSVLKCCGDALGVMQEKRPRPGCEPPWRGPQCPLFVKKVCDLWGTPSPHRASPLSL